MSRPRDPSLITFLAAFAAVYFIWGSTYLAIRYAIETIPPLFMASVRFLVAGGILFAWTSLRGAERPTLRQWRSATIVGGLLLVGGNGGVVVAEQWVPSGLAALLVAAVPLWMVLLDWRWGSGGRPTARATLGLATGLGGVLLLLGSEGAGAGGRHELFGAGLVLFASLCWATGSIYSRYVEAPPRPLRWVGMQMLAGGALLMPLSGITGEWPDIDLGGASMRSMLALAYLIVFGAIVAYSAYIWLLGVTTPARAGTYAYVNPVVALALGAWLADEPLTFRSLAAAAIIVGSVVLITTGSAGRTPAPRDLSKQAA